MSISRQLSQLLGGELVVRSEPGVGVDSWVPPLGPSVGAVRTARLGDVLRRGVWRSGHRPYSGACDHGPRCAHPHDTRPGLDRTPLDRTPRL
ncbi:MAG: hypothetical protein ABIZ05_02310 [Pseudonocardiaceae bacterium]